MSSEKNLKVLSHSETNALLYHTALKAGSLYWAIEICKHYAKVNNISHQAAREELAEVYKRMEEK